MVLRGIRTRSSSKPEAVDPLIRPLGPRNQIHYCEIGHVPSNASAIPKIGSQMGVDGTDVASDTAATGQVLDVRCVGVGLVRSSWQTSKCEQLRVFVAVGVRVDCCAPNHEFNMHNFVQSQNTDTTNFAAGQRTSKFLVVGEFECFHYIPVFFYSLESGTSHPCLVTSSYGIQEHASFFFKRIKIYKRINSKSIFYYLSLGYIDTVRAHTLRYPISPWAITYEVPLDKSKAADKYRFLTSPIF